MKFVILPSVTKLLSMNTSDENNEGNIQMLPYKLCRIVRGANPYLVFYIWSDITQKLVRVRREPPKGENQRVWFLARKAYFDSLLVSGHREVKDEKILPEKNFTTIELLEKVHDLKIKNKLISAGTAQRSKSSKYLKGLGLHEENPNVDIAPEI